MKPLRTMSVLPAFAVVLGGLPGIATGQQREVPDTYTALTTNMTPAGTEIKADILHWSTDEERRAAVAALAEEDVLAALHALPTAGVVWREGSAVGHSIKYAHRAETDGGGERITLITDKRIGASSFSPWTADQPATGDALEYSVVVLDTGAAEGTMSLAAAVSIDTESGTVALDRGTAPAVLEDVSKAPIPYWADTD